MGRAQEIATWVTQYQSHSPQNILKFAAQQFDTLALAFSGAEDVVLIDMLHKLKLSQIQVFCLDTGRLHPETYRFLDAVRSHYQLSLEVLFPEAEQVEALIKNKGMFSFYQDGHQECCQIRKVKPLQRKLNTVSAWITGQRQDQSPDTRGSLPAIEWDQRFELVKFNPLANWTSEQVWTYIDVFEVPFNSLHKQGFISIGCEPCTRATLPHEHERAGRWWWEEATQKECGLHHK